MILAADVGATKILLEAGELRDGRWQPALARRYEVEELAEISAALERFLGELETTRARQSPRPRASRGHGITAAAIGAAGPAIGNRIKMTHRPWIIDGDVLASRFGLKRVTVVNDLATAAYGIELLGPRDSFTLQPGRAAAGAPSVVLGVGTGLGIAYRLPGPVDRPRLPALESRRLAPVLVMPSEAGHCGFSPGSQRQRELWETLFARHGRVEAEQVASGVGLTNIYEHLAGRGECSPSPSNRPDPAWISSGATERGDKGCIAAMSLFAECLGNITGDCALALMTRGGIYLAGGVTAKVARTLDTAAFRAAFCAKGTFSSALMKIPVRAVTNERLMILGAARIAAA